jgi:hypothetical protein
MFLFFTVCFPFLVFGFGGLYSGWSEVADRFPFLPESLRRVAKKAGGRRVARADAWRRFENLRVVGSPVAVGAGRRPRDKTAQGNALGLPVITYRKP